MEILGISIGALNLHVFKMLIILGEGEQIQNALQKKTGQRTVPNVFINKKHIGGCDDTFNMHRNGKVQPMLDAVAKV